MKNKIKVLIVDDQPLVLDILTKGISKDRDIEVVGTATDGFLALNQIPRLKPDVIILDMEMPRMNGLQFLRNLMPVNPIPTIVLSALTSNDSKITDEAFTAGAVDFLKKPEGGSKGLATLLVQLWTKIKIAASQDVQHLKRIKQEYNLPTNTLDRTQKTNKIILGMGMMDIVAESGKELKIFALGSCIGLGLFCPLRKITGLAHIALPNSKTDPSKAEGLPGYFSDTAIPALLNKMLDAGCPQNKIYAKIAGGSKTRAEIGDFFGIGQKNTIGSKAALVKAGITLLAEDTGGDISRTATLNSESTHMSLYYPEKGEWTI